MISGAILAASFAGSLAARDTSELRLRSATDGLVREVRTVPSLTLEMHSRTLAFRLGYAAQLRMYGQPTRTLRLDALQSVVGGTSWQGTRLRLSLSGTATYGIRNFSDFGLGDSATFAAPSAVPADVGSQPESSVPGPPIRPAVLQTFPQADAISYLAYGAMAGADWAWTRRLSLHGAVGYSYSGGVGDADRATLPALKGARAEAALIFSASRADTLTTRASMTQQSVVGGTTNRVNELYDLSERWTHHWTRLTRSHVGGGMALLLFTPSPGAPTSRSVSPTAEAGVETIFPTYQGHDRVVANMLVLYAPLVNRLTGIVSKRLNSMGSVVYSTGLAEFAVRGMATQTIPWSSPGALRMIRVELSTGYRVSEQVMVHAGYVRYWQSFADSQLDLPAAWQAFAGLTYQDNLMRF